MTDARPRPPFSIAAKIDLIIVAALALGLGAVFSAFALSLVSSRDSLTRGALLAQAELLYVSIENFMLAGEAPIAVGFFRDAGIATRGTEVQLYRRDGGLAFSDDTTIRRVNEIRKKEAFKPRNQPPAGENPGLALPRFSEAVAIPPAELFFRDDAAGKAYFRAFRPLVNLPKCTVCHGSDHTIRGVVDIRSDVTAVVRSQGLIVAGAGGGFLLVVLVLALLIGSFLRRVLVEPVREIGKLCAAVRGGDFTGRVGVRSRDEIGELAGTVNGMVEGLHERYELTKYVSAGTIGAIRASQEPARARRTLLFTDVRGFTAYTERREAEQVVGILNLLLEDEARLIAAEDGDIDKFVGDEVVSVFSGEDAALRACRAALAIRDLVAERAADFDGLLLGMGIATGSVIQGMIGSRLRADFTVIGDSVNVASRLCSLAKPGQVLACGATRKAAAEAFAWSGPFGARLKGKLELQRVWLLAGPGSAGK